MKTWLGIAYLAAVLFSFRALPAQASGKGLLSINAGVNGLWPSGQDIAFPNAFEAGATASSSLSPHISLVAAGFRNVSEGLWRGDAGVRVTASDVERSDFNIYLGALYRGGQDDPTEFAADAGFGWTPLASCPALIIGADAGYGLDSHKLLSVVALRWRFSVR